VSLHQQQIKQEFLSKESKSTKDKLSFNRLYRRNKNTTTGKSATNNTNDIMSRAFTPPDTLSKDDIRTIADVRREIWTNSLKGLCIGTFSGYGLYSIVKFGQRRKVWNVPFPLNRNAAFLSVLLGGALGSFVMSITTGKNEVHKLHPIFEIGRRRTTVPDDATPLSAYELSILQAKERDEDLRSMRQKSLYHSADEQEVMDRVQREKNRLYRRATLTKSMEHVGGLSDSHGGKWIPDDVDDEQNNHTD
jgi:hypothetical protein